MPSWVLDENVFDTASNQHEDACSQAFFILELIYHYHRWVLDYDQVLLAKYRLRFDKCRALKSWYGRMVRNAGHIQYASTRLSAEIDLRLGQLRFDPDDLCFVGAALNADRLIVSVDSDFREHAVAEYFKQELNLDIFAIEEAIEELKKR